MYGMVHRAVRQMVVEREGSKAWHEIELAAGVSATEMVGLVVYDDAVTLRILGAASERLGTTTSQVLEDFGRYWLNFIDNKAYRSIMDYAGKDLVSLLTNLDRLHAAVLAAMPKARVPSFTVLESDDQGVLVRYQSQRRGLEPMVTGLLLGLLDKFDLEGTVEAMPATDGSIDFKVTHRQKKSPANDRDENDRDEKELVT